MTCSDVPRKSGQDFAGIRDLAGRGAQIISTSELPSSKYFAKQR